jgi:hypothetical protein
MGISTFSHYSAFLGSFPKQYQQQQSYARQAERHQQTQAMASGLDRFNRPELKRGQAWMRGLLLRLLGALKSIVNQAHA